MELLVTVLLARNRRLPPTVAAGVPHAELAAELITLPSGLLAKVCEAIVKLKVRLGAACACLAPLRLLTSNILCRFPMWCRERCGKLARLSFCKCIGRAETQPLTVVAKSRDPTMAVRPTQLRLRSSGGSIRGPLAARAMVDARPIPSCQAFASQTTYSGRSRLRRWMPGRRGYRLSVTPNLSRQCTWTLLQTLVTCSRRHLTLPPSFSFGGS